MCDIKLGIRPKCVNSSNTFRSKCAESSYLRRDSNLNVLNQDVFQVTHLNVLKEVAHSTLCMFLPLYMLLLEYYLVRFGAMCLKDSCRAI